MKYRLDFVTNSSSSSYICDVCGRSESGWDMCLSEAEMFECENGHTICEDEITEDIDYKEYLLSMELSDEEKERVDNEEDLEEMCYSYELRYYLPEKYCPICNFMAYSQSDMKRYLSKEYKISDDEVFTEIKKINKRRRKLYDGEYIQYICTKFDLTETNLIETIKEKFKTYKEFDNYIRK